METFTLVTWLWAGWAFREVRQPGLTHIECKLQLMQVHKPWHGRCVPEPYIEPDIKCAWKCSSKPGNKFAWNSSP